MYLQYVLAKYFSSDLGIDQISWILGGQIPAHVKIFTSWGITNDVNQMGAGAGGGEGRGGKNLNNTFLSILQYYKGLGFKNCN